jgi:hypothetical protein
VSVTRRNDYKRLFADVRAILNRHDPVGLIAMGSPSSEYELEVGTILPRLRTTSGPEDVAGVVDEEFVKWFGQSQDKKTLRAIGDEVWEVWERFRESEPAS